MNLSIEDSIGFGGRNNPVDVAVVQKLLKIAFTQRIKVKGRSTSVKSPPITVNGVCEPDLSTHIKNFQTAACGMAHPDGRIDPHGGTFQALAAQAGPAAGAAKHFLFGPQPANTRPLTSINPKRLRRFFIKQSGLGLTLTKGEDFLTFFKYLQNDPAIQDIRWAVYILTTAHHETEFSFKADKNETGKGKSLFYGSSIKVTDTIGCRGPKNTVYTNYYYGRGYTQLTLEDNYKKMGKALGLGLELHINPGRVCEPDIAYFAISQGMIRGLFTNQVHKLSDHINGRKCDYVNARKIVNGLKDAKKIAGRAEKIEIIVRLCSAASGLN